MNLDNLKDKSKDELIEIIHQQDRKLSEANTTLFKIYKENSTLQKKNSTQKLKIEQLHKELKKEQARKYDVYIKEDQVTYYEMEQRLKDAEYWFKQMDEQLSISNAKRDEMQRLLLQVYGTQDLQEAKKLALEYDATQKQIKQNKAGRPRTNDRTVALIRELYASGLSMQKVADQIGVSAGTVHNIIKKYDNQ